MQNLLIRTRLIGFCLLGILLAALIGLVGYWSGEKQNGALADVAINFSALRNHLESDMMHDALRADVLAALRAGHRPDRPPSEDQGIREDLREHAANFRKNLADNEQLPLGAEVRSAINQLRPALDAYIRSAEVTVERALKGASNTDADFAAFTTSFETLEKDLAAVSDLIETSTTQAREAAGQAASTARLAIVGATLAGVLLLALLSALLTRSIVRPLHRLERSFDELKQGQGDLTTHLPVTGSDEIARITSAFNTFLSRLHDMVLRIKQSSGTVASTSDALSGQSKQAAQRATQVADRIMQVSAATEEISVAVSEVANSVHEVLQAASRAARVATDGQQSMTESMAMTTAMVEAVKVSVARIDELGQSVQQIGGIALVIKEITDQTNLLALNAAIEAARAGEQGRGFAIVADEVRKLAERTAASTADISSITGTIRDSVTGAVTAMASLEGQVEDGARQLAVVQGAQKQIGAAADQVTGLAQDIADAAKQQSTAVNNAAGNMEQVSTLSEETSAAIAAMDQAAAGLNGAADQLKRLVAQFTVHEAGA